jgi:hypothetical protein
MDDVRAAEERVRRAAGIPLPTTDPVEQRRRNVASTAHWARSQPEKFGDPEDYRGVTVPAADLAALATTGRLFVRLAELLEVQGRVQPKKE